MLTLTFGSLCLLCAFCVTFESAPHRNSQHSKFELPKISMRLQSGTCAGTPLCSAEALRISGLSTGLVRSEMGVFAFGALTTIFNTITCRETWSWKTEICRMLGDHWKRAYWRFVKMGLALLFFNCGMCFLLVTSSGSTNLHTCTIPQWRFGNLSWLWCCPPITTGSTNVICLFFNCGMCFLLATSSGSTNLDTCILLQWRFYNLSRLWCCPPISTGSTNVICLGYDLFLQAKLVPPSWWLWFLPTILTGSINIEILPVRFSHQFIS